MSGPRVAPAGWWRLQIAGSGEWLATRAQFARSPAQRMIGLLSRSDLPEGEALVFLSAPSIHTYGMRFAIDVIVFSRDWRVVALWRGMPPWRLLLPVRGAWGIVEMAEGSIERAGVGVGDELHVLAAS